MRRNSLFGEMSLRFGTHPENLATEALLYILRQHSEAWPALHRVFRRTEIELPIDLTFRSQVWGEDQSQPDLIGSDAEGDPVLIVEAKFWAGLTTHQPVTYLQRLVIDKPGILVVVCPGRRFATLWEKINDRCETGGIAAQETVDLESEFRYRRIATTHGLCLVSWAFLLATIRQEAEIKADESFIGDINQLNGLCYRMDTEAFIPLHPRDLSSEMGRRVQHFADIIDRVVEELVSQHGADISGLSTGGSQSEYGRYFRLYGFPMFLSYAPKFWARFGETPIWLHVYDVIDDKWGATPRIREGLDRLPSSKYQKVPESESPNVVGLELPLSVELHDVIASVIDQIKQVAKSCAANQGDPSPNLTP